MKPGRFTLFEEGEELAYQRVELRKLLLRDAGDGAVIHGLQEVFGIEGRRGQHHGGNTAADGHVQEVKALNTHNVQYGDIVLSAFEQSQGQIEVPRSFDAAHVQHFYNSFKDVGFIIHSENRLAGEHVSSPRLLSWHGIEPA